MLHRDRNKASADLVLHSHFNAVGALGRLKQRDSDGHAVV